MIGGFQTLAGDMEVGTYSVLVFITQRLLWPLTTLGRTLDDYQRSMASTQRVLDLIDTPIGITSGKIALDPEPQGRTPLRQGVLPLPRARAAAGGL